MTGTSSPSPRYGDDEQAAPERNAAPTPSKTASTTAALLTAWRANRRTLFQALAIFLGTVGAILAVWQLTVDAGLVSTMMPTPAETARRGGEILSTAFVHGEGGQIGIFWHLLASLRRVIAGFAVAVLIAVPLGFLIGLSTPTRWAFEPFIQILRPVSPLAWLPIGLALVRNSEATSLFVIVLTAVWPVMLTTVEAVRAVNPDYRDLARTLGTRPIDVLRYILFPATLPGIVTGMRLSLATAWLVIIAAEMLVGGKGMGYFVWNMWNRLDIAGILVAIVIIGVVGFLLDHVIAAFEKVLPHA